MVLEELVQTEITFHQQLQASLDIYRVEMEKNFVVDRVTMNILFGGVEMILEQSSMVQHQLLTINNTAEFANVFLNTICPLMELFR